MVNIKRRVSFILIVILLMAAVAIVALLSFGGEAYADDTNLNVILDESKSIEAGAPVAYSLSPTSWEYGANVALPTPRLKYDHDARIVAQLTLDGKVIAEDVETDNLAYYINRYMPHGEYTLTFSAGGVQQPNGKSDWWESTGADENEDGDATGDEYTEYVAISQSYSFTVTKAKLDTDYAERIKSAFNSEFRFIYDGQAHFLPDENILTEIESEGIYDRGEGTYWAQDEAAEYFDGFTVTYNFFGTDTEHYHTQAYFIGGSNDPDCKDATPVEAGKYRFYYNVSTRNYVDLAADNLSDYVLHTVIVQEVAVPVLTAEYNGDVQTANVSDNAYYTVVKNDGGADAGVYEVVLRLRNSDRYIWAGQSFGNNNDELSVDFEITKAANGWVVLPSVDRWTEGEYNAAENAVVGSAKFGETVIIITDENDNVVYNNVGGVNKLDSAPAGVYTLTAYVSESDNWEGIAGDKAYTKIIKVYKKAGLAWWAILLIVIVVLGVIACVLFVLDRLGILRVMSKKHVLKMRLDANMDATKAAIRFANAKQGGNGANIEFAAQPTEPVSDKVNNFEQAEKEPPVPTEQEQPEQVEQSVQAEQTDNAEQAQEPTENVESAPEQIAQDNVKFPTEDMINEYLYGMSAASASDTFTAGADSDGIIVATTFDKEEG